MGPQTSGLFFVIFLSCTLGIRLDGHGYTEVLIAINPAVPEKPDGAALLQRIEDMVKDASKYLYTTLGNRFYFQEVTVLVPSNWETQHNFKRAKTQTYERANVIIDEPNESYGDEPYTLQYGQCGEEGQYIHLTPNFLLNNEFERFYGSRGKVFVHEWAHLRWGVYDETSEEQPFYWSSNDRVEATRCNTEITGDYCNPLDVTCKDRCEFNLTTGLPTSDCIFLMHPHTSAKESLMAYPSLFSVVDFCSTDTHNAEAPNRQNLMCDNRAVRDVILHSSVDAGVPEPSALIPNVYPTVFYVQRKTRVVCLTLDVSGSMRIIEDTALVGIVVFSSSPIVKKDLTEINGEQSREELVSALPTSAGGGTQMCAGIKTALEVVKKDDGQTEGDELVLLTDGEANDNLTFCLETVKTSSAIVHTIALGRLADKTLITMANYTDGIFHQSADSIDSNALVDAFASLTSADGNLTQQAIQLESSGKTTTTGNWFNGTFSVDWTVGNETVISIVYQVSSPKIYIRSPKGTIFTESHFQSHSSKTLTLKIPGTAEVGEWNYDLLNVGSTQGIAITVTSRAASADVPPITVKAHMSQKSTNGSKPLVVYAVVTQRGLPVILANVTATLQSENGQVETLDLKDDGTAADALRHDGIYSRYFTNMTSARYSLKVTVKNKEKARISRHRHSGAPYVPGYVVNGTVQLNPPKPPVNHQPVEVGSFSRTATGESFVVQLPPGSNGPPAFPPSKITDLKASLEGDNVTLSWTAPGESYDQGTASLYHIRWSKDLGSLREDFDQAQVVNTSTLSPQEAGFTEEYSFLSSNFNITNGTQVFFAIAAENALCNSSRSEISNIARVVKFEPPPPSPPPPQHRMSVIAIATSAAVAAIVIVVALVVYF